MADILFLGAGIEAAITSTNGLADSDACTGFAGYNLLDRNKNTPWKAGSGSTHFIRVDMGADYTASAIGLINGNPLTGGAYSGTKWRMELKSDDNWAFASPTSRLGIQIPAAGDDPIWYEGFTEATDRYWRLTVYDPVDCVCQIGTILLGIPMVFSLPYNRPITKGKQAGIDIRETKGGKRYANKRYGGRNLWTPANFSILTQAQWDDLVTYLWDASSEGLYPVLFRDTDGSLHWVRVNKGGALFWTHNVHNIWDTPLTIETEL